MGASIQFPFKTRVSKYSPSLDGGHNNLCWSLQFWFRSKDMVDNVIVMFIFLIILMRKKMMFVGAIVTHRHYHHRHLHHHHHDVCGSNCYGLAAAPTVGLLTADSEAQ